MAERSPRIVWHLTVTEQVESSASKPAAIAGGSLGNRCYRTTADGLIQPHGQQASSFSPILRRASISEKSIHCRPISPKSALDSRARTRGRRHRCKDLFIVRSIITGERRFCGALLGGHFASTSTWGRSRGRKSSAGASLSRPLRENEPDGLFSQLNCGHSLAS